MITKEVQSKSILSKSKVFDYVVNPYVGCQHACTYCYAQFMKRFTGHREPWGQFVDIKMNAPELLEMEVTRKPKGRVWVSGVCDPYQPLERTYQLTQKCLEILIQHHWPVTIQTKSSLVLRDVKLFKDATDIEVGLSITTADDGIRKLFEPNAPPVGERIQILGELHKNGIRTFAMIAPMLPGSDGLATAFTGKVDYILIDRMNYHYADWVYKTYGLEDTKSDEFFIMKSHKLASTFKETDIECQMVFNS